MMRSIGMTIFAGIVVFATSASATFFLTQGDYDYLAAQGVERQSSVLRLLSPREESRLRFLINDPTQKDATARARLIHEALAEFESHQLWEKMNPGQVWGSPQRKN